MRNWLANAPAKQRAEVAAMLKMSFPQETKIDAERQWNVVADLLSKAAMGGFAGGSDNSMRGQMLNPLNVKRATSGSSSGSGAAIHEALPRPDSTPAVTFFWWTAGNTNDTLLTLVAEISDAIGWGETANEMAENAVKRV